MFQVGKRNAKWAISIVALPLLLSTSGCENIRMSSIPMYQDVGFDQVKPILESRCLPCHQGDYMGTNIPDFRTSADVYNPDRRSPLIVPGEPEKSRLLQVVYLMKDSEGSMPPVGHSLSVEEKDIIGEWVRQGASWPDDEVLKSDALKNRSLRR